MEMRFICSRDWIFKDNLDELRPQTAKIYANNKQLVDSLVCWWSVAAKGFLDLGLWDIY